MATKAEKERIETLKDITASAWDELRKAEEAFGISDGTVKHFRAKAVYLLKALEVVTGKELYWNMDTNKMEVI